MGTLLFILLGIFFNLIGNGTGNYYSQISYPRFEYHYCYLKFNNQDVKGQCKNFAQCPVAIDLWRNHGVYPSTCWYEGEIHVVCCLEKTALNFLNFLRINVTTMQPAPYRNTMNASKASALNKTKGNSAAMDRIISSNGKGINSTVSSTTATIAPISTTTAGTISTTTKLSINDECPIPESQKNGTCKEYPDCPDAIKTWRLTRTYPTLCQSITNIVCCSASGSAKTRRLRRSEMYCESIYGPPFGVGGYAIGVATKPMEFPYMVGLGWSSELDNTTSFRCGGVLITNTFVLTAAHCTTSRGKPPVRVKVGGDNLTDSTIGEVNIAQIVVHPEYDTETRSNDIALIRLEIEVQKLSACLWSENNLEMNNLTAVGYGNTRFAGPSSDQLIKALLLSVPTSQCQGFYDEDLLDAHMCAGNSKNDTCQGDSGGPLLMYRDSKFYPFVVGITSFGQPCGGDTPGVYTRVSEFIDWIESIVWA